jgi:hypothetical protein
LPAFICIAEELSLICLPHHKLPNYLAILGACSPGMNRFAALMPYPPKGNAETRAATKNMIL